MGRLLLLFILLPAVDGVVSGTYEARQSAGPDYPLAADNQTAYADSWRCVPPLRMVCSPS